ncbi:MAG TPA: acetoacetate decarboxylase family protein [Nocardioidaceae bacterium]|nr:acetoacetate decarboxylase family protein [Nocardioidaceae bacterium]
MPFPSPPWTMQGTMWLSLFPVRTGTSERPPGMYGAAFVEYVEGSTLTYRELLLARLVRDGAIPRVHITDIWVDSEASRDGGRSLWAIPKDLAELHVLSSGVGPATRVACDANINGSPLAAARFTAPRIPSLRTPFVFTVTQEREDGSRVVTPVSGTSCNLPVMARWDFGAAGPLSWLHGRRPIGTFRLQDFRLTFGA